MIPNILFSKACAYSSWSFSSGANKVALPSKKRICDGEKILLSRFMTPVDRAHITEYIFFQLAVNITPFQNRNLFTEFLL